MEKKKNCYLCKKKSYVSQMAIYRENPKQAKPDGLICSACSRK